MSEFFKGWKRKFGVLTLLVACVLAGGWVRSIFVHDVLLFVDRGEALGLWGSQGGSLRLSKTNDTDDHRWGLPMWQNWPATEGVHPFDEPNIEWEWRCCGFGVGDDSTERIVPYWSIVIPLMLLSAWLLLTKPRPPKHTASTRKPLPDPSHE